MCYVCSQITIKMKKNFKDLSIFYFEFSFASEIDFILILFYFFDDDTAEYIVIIFCYFYCWLGSFDDLVCMYYGCKRNTGRILEKMIKGHVKIHDEIWFLNRFLVLQKSKRLTDKFDCFWMLFLRLFVSCLKKVCLIKSYPVKKMYIYYRKRNQIIEYNNDGNENWKQFIFFSV